MFYWLKNTTNLLIMSLACFRRPKIACLVGIFLLHSSEPWTTGMALNYVTFRKYFVFLRITTNYWLLVIWSFQWNYLKNPSFLLISYLQIVYILYRFKSTLKKLAVEFSKNYVSHIWQCIKTILPMLIISPCTTQDLLLYHRIIHSTLVMYVNGKRCYMYLYWITSLIFTCETVGM